jgi:hypothetical protein
LPAASEALCGEGASARAAYLPSVRPTEKQVDASPPSEAQNCASVPFEVALAISAG